jgi:RAB protein geranylgeranyltransferase component A
MNIATALELSVVMETVTNDVNQLKNPNEVEVLYQESKNELVVGSRAQRKATSTGLQQRLEVVRCCCEATGHIKPKFKFKDLICTKCNRKGHLKSVKMTS